MAYSVKKKLTWIWNRWNSGLTLVTSPAWNRQKLPGPHSSSHRLQKGQIPPQPQAAYESI